MYIIPICIYVDKIGIKVQQKKKMFTQVHIQHPINVILYFQIGMCILYNIYVFFHARKWVYIHISIYFLIETYLLVQNKLLIKEGNKIKSRTEQM